MIRYLIIAMRTENFSDSVIEPHKEFLAQLRAVGKLDLTGPFTDKSGGAYTIFAENLSAAKAIAFKDPIHTTGASHVTVYEWDAS